MRLGICKGKEVVDITELGKYSFNCFMELVHRSEKTSMDIYNYVTEILENSSISSVFSYEEFNSGKNNKKLVMPIQPSEIWGCGVTYTKSNTAREFETGTKGIYDLVYDAIRPEIFFKGTANRCVGSNEEIGIRGDAHWNVPEPELGFILNSKQKIIGYTGGNDVTSRDIEAENPLYLPQAKIFGSCCALGPSIITPEEVGTSPNLQIKCRIIRSGNIIFRDSTNTSQMKRSLEELLFYLCRYNPVPAGTVCLTGTGIVPPEDFSLLDGDLVEIDIEKI
jgi:2-dehydro-3-deoxy-D-arabinonate dehydratase